MPTPDSLSTDARVADKLVSAFRRLNFAYLSETCTDWSQLMASPVENFSHMYFAYTRDAPVLLADSWTSTFCHRLGTTIPLYRELMEKSPCPYKEDRVISIQVWQKSLAPARAALHLRAPSMRLDRSCGLRKHPTTRPLLVQSSPSWKRGARGG